MPEIAIPGFELLQELGRGGMGVVYRARQISMDRPVAIKVLLENSSESTLRERFLREVRAIAHLSHPNIVSAFDAGEANGIHYYVMEFVDGQTTTELLKNQGRLPEAQCVSIGIQIGRALQHIAASGMVHRDIKPQNIMIDREGVAKLCDLGVAKVVAGSIDPSLTSDGAAIGTPLYLSPEQALGEKKIDIRADLYSLGATLFHLAAGVPPFMGSRGMDILVAHIKTPAPSIRSKAPWLSDHFARIIARLLAKRPEERFATPADMIREFQSIPSTRMTSRLPSPIDAPPPSTSRTATQRFSTRTSVRLASIPKKSSPMPWIVMGAAVLLLLIAVSYLPSGSIRSSPRPASVRPEVESPASGPSVEPLDARHQERWKELGALTGARRYEFLVKACAEFASASQGPLWRSELKTCEQQLLRESDEAWSRLLKEIEPIRESPAAVLDKLNAFPAEHRALPGSQKMTRAGQEHSKFLAAVLADLQASLSELRLAFEAALKSSNYSEALSCANRLEKFPTEDPDPDDWRWRAIHGAIEHHTRPPLSPEKMQTARKELSALFDAVRSSTEIYAIRDRVLLDTEKTYSDILQAASKYLLDHYGSLFQEKFDGLLLERRYPQARELAAELLSDPRHAGYQTALHMEGLDPQATADLLKLSFSLENAAARVARLESLAAAARKSAPFAPLARFLDDARAALLLEWGIERAARSLVQSGWRDPASRRNFKVERMPTAGCTLLLSSGSTTLQAALSPAAESPIGALELAKHCETARDAGPDDYAALQAALIVLYSRDRSEAALKPWVSKIKDTAWPQYEARLKSLGAPPAPAPPPAPPPSVKNPPRPAPKPKPEDRMDLSRVFLGRVELVEPGKHRVIYDFSDKKQLADFDTGFRIPVGGNLVCEVNQNGFPISGRGLVFWRGLMDGDVVLEVRFDVGRRHDNMGALIHSAPMGQSGVAVYLDCDLNRPRDNDDEFGLFRFPPANWNDPMAEAGRISHPPKKCHMETGNTCTLRLSCRGGTYEAVFQRRGSETVSGAIKDKPKGLPGGHVGVWVWDGDMIVKQWTIEGRFNDAWLKQEWIRKGRPTVK
jgi:serine/threonine-protein kinase